MRVILTFILFFTLTWAQPSKDSEIKSFAAIKLSQPIIIDGEMDDAWNALPKQNSFIQEEPNPFQPASKETEFKFTYDDDNIYFFIRVYDDKDKIITQTGRRDNAFWNGDWVLIYLDPQHDKTTGFRFGINPSNVQHDARLYNDGWDDDRWDAIWYSQTKEWENGWQAEVRIPLRALKFQEKDIQSWGLNVERYMRRSSENSYWEKVDPDVGFKVSRLGVINDLKGLKSKNEINIIPAGVGIFDSNKDYDPTTSDRAFGFDVRYNFDAQHSILATFRPDFSQIEADQDQINISDFPLQFGERRPFFLEGNELYQMPDEIYYSRNMTKPTSAFKFFGNSGKFKYGLTTSINEGFAFKSQDDGEGGFEDVRVENREVFIIPRIKYEEGNKLAVGYFGGYRKGEYDISDLANFSTGDHSIFNAAFGNQSGLIHAFDVTARPDDHWRFVGFYSTTDIDKVNESNHSYRFQSNYNSDTYSGQIKLHKKTNFYEQTLLGRYERNNVTESNLWLQRKIRFEDQELRNIRINFNWNHNGTYDNKVVRTNYNLQANFNFQSEKYGYYGFGSGRWVSVGDFRQYYNNDAEEDYNRNTANMFDNRGYFQGVRDDSDGWWLWAESDFSRPVAIGLNFNADSFKKSKAYFYGATIQLKPSQDLKIRLRWNAQDYKGSEFIDRAYLYTTNLRTEYTILNNLFVKIFTQYNKQSRGLSNNVIFTYEYIRGSFIYFAYNEVGNILRDQEFTSGGNLIPNYDLGRRTFSVKWTYSYFL